MVREATRVALQADSEQLRIGVLTLVAGVSVPTASVILHWFHRDPYPIVDVRALASLGAAQPAWYPFEFWRSYVDECRRLAREHGVSMRELDRALWQWSKDGRAESSRKGRGAKQADGRR